MTGPVQADLENGMQKLQKRTACIELSLSQRSLDQKCFSETITSSEGSAFERADVLSIRTESSMTNTTYLSSDSSCPDDDGHPKTAELGTLGEIQGDNVADNEIKVLKAQVASLKSEKDAIRQKCDEDIAFKDEQMQNVVSICQALSAENEELKAQAKRPATSPPVRSPVQQAPSSELVKLREIVKHQHSDLCNTHRTMHQLAEQLNISEATKQQQISQLYKAFTVEKDLGAKLTEATNNNKQLDAEVNKLKQLKSQVTGELVDSKSECERAYCQNRILKETIEMDPAKAAIFHKANEHLKNEIADQEERRIQAEERNIQLQKKMDKEQVQSKAEITALTEENKTLTVAVGDLQSSKRALLNSIDDYFIKVPGRNIADSLKAAVKSFRSAGNHDQAIDTRLNDIIATQSRAVKKTKGLEIHCHQLETAVKEQEIKYMDLEADFRGKSSKVDALEMEADCVKSEHSKALTKKDDELSKAKKAAAHAEHLLELFKNSNADTVTAWFFKRSQKEVTKAKDDLKHAEKRIENLQQDLYTKTQNEKWNKDLQSYNQWKGVAGNDDPTLLTEIADLKQKLADFEKGLCTPDVVPWADHLLRVEEVQAQTTARLQNESRAQLEATVNAELVAKFGEKYAHPLQELCGYLWNRNLGFEEWLKKMGVDENELNDNQRNTLMYALRELFVLP